MSRRPPLPFIFAVTLTGILNNTLVTPALPDILDEFGVSPDRGGVLVAAGSVAGIVVAPIVGVLADRFGRRVVLTSCLAIFGLFGGVAALAPTFPILLAARLLQGFGSAGLINLAVVLIGDHWTGPERTRLVGRNSAVLTVGLAALPLLSGVITEAAGWRTAFGAYTVALATAAAAWMVLDSSRPPHPPGIAEQLAGATRAVAHPVIATTIVAGFFIFMMIFGLVLTVFPIHLAETYGMGAGARGVMISLPAITSTLVAFNLDRVRGIASTRFLIAGAAGLFMAAFFALGATASLTVVAVAALAYGLAEGGLIPTLQDLAIEASPDAHRGAVVAAWVSAARLGQTIGPLLAGVGLATLGSGSTLMVGASVAGVILLIGILGPVGAEEGVVSG